MIERKQEVVNISLILKSKSLLFSYSILPHLQASCTREHIQTSGSQTGPRSRVVDDSHSFLATDKSHFIFLIILFSSTCITTAFLFHQLSASSKKHPSFSWPVQNLNPLCSAASPS